VDVPGFVTGVNVDGWLLPDTVSTIFSEHKQNQVPVIAGSNANEATTLVGSYFEIPKTLDDYRRGLTTQYGVLATDYDSVYPVKTEAEIRKAVFGSFRDTSFTLQMRTWVRMNGPAKAFLYQFSHVQPRPGAKEYGAFHGSEILYAFANTHVEPWMQELDKRVAEQMSSYWVNFATTGDPNGKGLPMWTPYDATDEPYMDLGDTFTMKNHLRQPQVDFLERFEFGRPVR
jgi:para-nitrobenzyl esterase